MNARTFPVSAAELAETEGSTSTSVDADESSVQSSQPIEYFDIALSTGVTYRVAAGERDLQVGTIVYTATPGARSDLDMSQATKRKEVTLSLPVNHAVVKRWFHPAGPPRQLTVTIWCKQERSAMTRRNWLGLVTQVAVDGNIAKLTVPARTTNTIQRFLPTITTGPNCVNILYDSACRAPRASFQVSATAMIVNGRDVRLDMGSLAKVGNNWAEGGELVHVPTGERMTIAAQTDADPTYSSVTTLTMQFPIAELKAGDAVVVYAGCDHGIQTCFSKFANQPNFIGDPYKSLKNPFFPTGFGTVEEA